MTTDFRKLAHLAEQLGDDRFEALIDPSNTGKVRELCDQMLRSGSTTPTPASRWYERDGVIYTSVVSNGWTAAKWIASLEKGGVAITEFAKKLLLGIDFRPSAVGTTYQLAILKGTLFASGDIDTHIIHKEAHRRQLIKPQVEIACLLRQYFSDQDFKAMGMWGVVVSHECIQSPDGVPSLLSVECGSLTACSAPPGRTWAQGGGFVFEVSRTTPKN
jgi:hypothetical protein